MLHFSFSVCVSARCSVKRCGLSTLFFGSLVIVLCFKVPASDIER